MQLKFVLLTALLVGACSPTIGGDDDEGESDSLPTDEDATATEIDHDAMAGVVDKTAPHLEAFFAVPLANGNGDATLENKILELVNGTPSGARIRISMFHWTRTKVAKAVVAAHQRGVDVQIVLDKQANEVGSSLARVADDSDPDDVVPDEDVDAAETPNEDEPTTLAKSVVNPAIQILQTGLPASAITFCTRGNGSCQGNGIDHNKIYMFSTTGGSKKVVVQSSANLTTHLLHNNLVISRNDADLYDAYVGYFAKLKAHKENLDYYRSAKGDHTIAYYYPRESGDTIISVLDKVKCTSASHIRVAMAFFTDGRMAIAKKLAALKHAGCDVRVNMRKAGKDSSANIIHTLRAGGVSVGLYPDAHGANIHSKYLIVDSAYETAGQGHPHRKLVWTGSHNYTGGALRNNDEVLLRVDNGAVFDAFVHNWNVIRAQINGA